jgi:hypothetical protein
MSTVIWKLVYGGVTKTIGDWGFALPRITRRNQDVDELVLTTDPDDAATDAAIFAYGQTVVLLRNEGTDGAADVQWFTGEVRGIRRVGAPVDQQIAYTIKGPWWWAEHTIYQQSWNAATITIDPQDGTTIPATPIMSF